MRALRDGRIIVNVDVCINKQNVAYIDQIVALCLSVGVQRVRPPARHPAGRGVREPRRSLLRSGRAPAAPAEGLPPEPPSQRRDLDESLPGRVPRGPGRPDPGPAQDARRGERPALPGAHATSTRACRSSAGDKERCQYCFIEPFCTTADRVDRAPEPGELGRLVDRRGRRSRLGPYADLTPRASCPSAAASSASRSTICRTLEGLRVHGGRRHLRPSRSAPRDWSIARAVPQPRSCSRLREPEQLDVAARAGRRCRAGVEVEIELNQRTAPWLLAHRERVRTYLDARPPASAEPTSS